MADDGSWPSGAGPENWEPGDARTRVAIDQLRVALGAAERRLADPDAEPLSTQTLSGLIQTLEVLARRVAAYEAAAEARANDRAAALERIAERLEIQAEAQAAREAAMSARLDLMLDQLGKARAEAEGRKTRKEPAAIRMVLVGASAAAAISVVGAGAALIAKPELLPAALPAVLEQLGLRPGLKPAGVTVGPKAAVSAPVPVAPTPQDTYAAVSGALARGEANALARLTGLAEAGDAEAQLHLASLYETGEAGLPQDLGVARLWTERAARTGDRIAMHNLALFLMQGEGGERDVTQAAVWFRKAAEQGIVDSQYNLGLLYEAGRGVEKNLSEAYRWFSIAANAGDTAAREKQLEVESLLKASERSALDRAAAGFKPGASQPAQGQDVIGPAATVSDTQALLARKGYYVGPIDGVPSPAFRAAAAAFLRDQDAAAQ
ncbi:MAG: hypothetical protein DI570_03990 [Phenylobacterium zucineum]|nr:MAG: hypothetical protein DI570_03990 [Phenylobacterium zucineum]